MGESRNFNCFCLNFDVLVDMGPSVLFSYIRFVFFEQIQVMATLWNCCSRKKYPFFRPPYFFSNFFQLTFLSLFIHELERWEIKIDNFYFVLSEKCFPIFVAFNVHIFFMKIIRASIYRSMPIIIEQFELSVLRKIKVLILSDN